MLSLICVTLASAIGAASCPLPDPRAGLALDYADMKGFVLNAADPQFNQFAPVILVEHFGTEYNRIGTPAARLDDKGEEDIYVDPAAPTYYLQRVEWTGDHGKYTNLIYRTHFQMSKGNSNSTDGGKGLNVGMLTIVTLNEQGKPVWINTVGTCGCFHAILPTNFLPTEVYPSVWDKEERKVYGEKLSGQLRYPEDYDANVRPVIFLRDGSHRVADMQVASIASVQEKYEVLDAKEAPIEDLRHLPLGTGETSFYFEEGPLKGLVKGAIKKRESFIIGAFIGDTRAGQDRIYGPVQELPRGFYTTINPVQKDGSDMWDYKSFLQHNGWHP